MISDSVLQRQLASAKGVSPEAQHTYLKSGNQGGTNNASTAWFFITVTIFLDLMAAGILAPVLPSLISHLGHYSASSTARLYSSLSSVWMVLLLFSTAAQGGLSDRIGRRPLILLSNMGLALDYVVMALAPNVSWLFVGRLISGLCAGSYSVASAFLAENTRRGERAVAYATFTAAAGAGAALGPAIGGILSVGGIRAPLWVAAALSFINFIYGFCVLKDGSSQRRTDSAKWSWLNPLDSLLYLYRSYPRFKTWMLIGVCQNLTNVTTTAILAIYTAYRFHWSSRSIGCLLAVSGFTRIGMQLALIRFLIRLMGERTLMLIGLSIQSCGMLLATISPNGFLFSVGVIVTAVGGLGNAAQAALISGEVASADQGRLAAAASSLFNTVGIVGPVLYGFLFAFIVRRSTSMSAAACPLLAATAFAFTGLLFARHVTTTESV